MKHELIELARFSTPQHGCPYVPSEIATMEYRIIAILTSRVYQQMLARGWRRFGHQFIRPACRTCVKCRGLRVLVNDFAPSKSQRRTLRRNSQIELVIQQPTVTDQHLRLYKAYQADMHFRRGWPLQTMTREKYQQIYLAAPGDFAREFLYFDCGKLIGVGLVDVVCDSLSSVYFFHDPTQRSRALGVFSLLQELRFARELGLHHHFLGYWVAECQSMAYKAEYRPHEILQRFPADDEEPVWLRAGLTAPIPTPPL
jgi:arginyl-tRNA--protein-N-Asp/Glu arginylyltransferase